jgi:hypothetical protein
VRSPSRTREFTRFSWRAFVHFSTRAFANPAEPRLLEVMRFIEAFVAVGQRQLTLPA